MAPETFIAIAAVTRDTWEADASAVYEMETEEGHRWWPRELVSPRVRTEQKPSAGNFCFFYHLEHTSNSFKQQAGKYHKHFDLFCRRAPFINNNGE